MAKNRKAENTEARQDAVTRMRKATAKIPYDGMEALAELYQGPVVEVTVGTGTEKRTWILPKALLKEYSNFFRAALEQPFREGLENKISLPEDNVPAFGIFVHWLYFQAIPSNFEIADKKNNEGIWLGYKVWVLGDKLLAVGFKNLAMQYVWDTHGDLGSEIFMENIELDYILTNTTSTSKLRKFVLDLFVSRWSVEDNLIYDEWEDIFYEHRDLCRALMLHFGNYGAQYKRKIGPVSEYLDSED